MSLSAAETNVAAAVDPSGFMAHADVIMTCLPDERSIELIFLTGDTPLQTQARPGTITIDHSTCSPELARRISNSLFKGGIMHIEAPLFGGVQHANTGQLFLALSGRDEARTLGMPNSPVVKIAAVIARGWRWVGGPGTAMALKVLQNGLGLVQLAAMGEVAAACRRLNFDPQLFYALVTEAGGMAATPLFRERFPRMLAGASVDARLAIAAKDADLFRRLIEPAAFSLADTTARAFGAAEAAGLADDDVTAVWRVFERAAILP